MYITHIPFSIILFITGIIIIIFSVVDMQLKIFMCSVGEEAELYFSLYHKENKYISEEYPNPFVTEYRYTHDILQICSCSYKPGTPIWHEQNRENVHYF